MRSALAEAPLHVAPGATEAATAHIRTLIPRLRVTVQQRATCQREMARLLDELAAGGDASGQKNEHRDVQILRSLVGVGKKVAATLLAEASQPLGDRDYHALRAHAGVAPVTKQSGRRLVVIMRQACNGRLRNAVYHWARVAVTRDPRSTEVYAVPVLAARAMGVRCAAWPIGCSACSSRCSRAALSSTRHAGPMKLRRRQQRQSGAGIIRAISSLTNGGESPHEVRGCAHPNATSQRYQPLEKSSHAYKGDLYGKRSLT